MKNKVTFEGIVTEVRCYQRTVYLFVKCNTPAKLKGKIVRFALRDENCSSPKLAAGISVGAKASIDRTTSERGHFYIVDALDDAISADII